MNLDFDKVIFLIDSSNHQVTLTHNTDMGIDFNVYPLNKALDYFQRVNSIKVYLFHNNTSIRSKSISHTGR